MHLDLTDQVAVITGAASGIGAASATQMVEAGAKVVVADIDDDAGEALVASLNQGKATSALYHHTDVTDLAVWPTAADLATSVSHDERQPAREIALRLHLAQAFRWFQQSPEQGLAEIAGTNDPGSHPVDTGIKEIKPQVNAIQVIAPHQLLGDGDQFIIQHHHMIAVPTHTPTDMEQKFGHIE